MSPRAVQWVRGITKINCNRAKEEEEIPKARIFLNNNSKSKKQGWTQNSITNESAITAGCLLSG